MMGFARFLFSEGVNRLWMVPDPTLTAGWYQVHGVLHDGITDEMTEWFLMRGRRIIDSRIADAPEQARYMTLDYPIDARAMVEMRMKWNSTVYVEPTPPVRESLPKSYWNLP